MAVGLKSLHGTMHCAWYLACSDQCCYDCNLRQ